MAEWEGAGIALRHTNDKPLSREEKIRLVSLLSGHVDAMDDIKDFAPILADPDAVATRMRVRTCARRHNLQILSGGVPHGAPPSSECRAVLFFSVHRDGAPAYDPNQQFSAVTASASLAYNIWEHASPRYPPSPDP